MSGIRHRSKRGEQPKEKGHDRGAGSDGGCDHAPDGGRKKGRGKEVAGRVQEEVDSIDYHRKQKEERVPPTNLSGQTLINCA